MLPPTTLGERVSECPVGWMDGFLPHSVKFDGTQNTLERRGEEEKRMTEQRTDTIIRKVFGIPDPHRGRGERKRLIWPACRTFSQTETD